MGVTTNRLFRWGNHYLLGIDEVDRQHERLGCLLNELHGAFHSGASQEVLAGKLETLIDEVRDHFTSEEGLMDSHGYPETDEHRSRHAFLMRQVLEFRNEYAAGSQDLTESTMIFLKDWLRDHMLGADKRMGDYLRPRLR